MGKSMSNNPTILIVEDNDALREQMKWALCDAYDVVESDTVDGTLEVFARQRPAVILLDMGLENVPDKGLELIDPLLLEDRGLKIIVITANTSESLGQEAVAKGAFDYLNKPIDIDHLRIILERALRINRLENQPSPSGQEPGIRSDPRLFMLGKSDVMERIFEFIRKLAVTDVNVLIRGESGTGKELCARAIHYHSSRSEMPFVPINCGAIPETLIESELFGYVKGAFTGANSDKTGLIESAAGGTLFLDEIGDMPMQLQVKLLRFLEDQQLQRVGETRLRSVDVRVVAATNKKVKPRESSDTMRSDLYYRLSEFEIELPPLRERGRDVLLIAQALIERNRVKFRQPKLSVSPRAEEVLQRYPWPGNVRELENKLNRAAILCSNQTIEPEDLDLSASSMTGSSLKDARAMFERNFVINLLRQHEFNISEAAKAADVSRPTLYDMMRKYDIRLNRQTRLD
jgi:two-component system NtrC family response regulator